MTVLKSAAFAASLTYLGEDDVENIDTFEVTVPHKVVCAGALLVAAGVLTGVAIDVPLGNADQILGWKVTNRTDQDMILKINTVVADRLAPGATASRMSPVAVSASDITAMSVTTTDTEAADGLVHFAIFGDIAP